MNGSQSNRKQNDALPDGGSRQFAVDHQVAMKTFLGTSVCVLCGQKQVRNDTVKRPQDYLFHGEWLSTRRRRIYSHLVDSNQSTSPQVDGCVCESCWAMLDPRDPQQDLIVQLSALVKKHQKRQELGSRTSNDIGNPMQCYATYRQSLSRAMMGLMPRALQYAWPHTASTVDEPLCNILTNAWIYLKDPFSWRLKASEDILSDEEKKKKLTVMLKMWHKVISTLTSFYEKGGKCRLPSDIETTRKLVQVLAKHDYDQLVSRCIAYSMKHIQNIQSTLCASRNKHMLGQELLAAFTNLSIASMYQLSVLSTLHRHPALHNHQFTWPFINIYLYHYFVIGNADLRNTLFQVSSAQSGCCSAKDFFFHPIWNRHVRVAVQSHEDVLSKYCHVESMGVNSLNPDPSHSYPDEKLDIFDETFMHALSGQTHVEQDPFITAQMLQWLFPPILPAVAQTLKDQATPAQPVEISNLTQNEHAEIPVVQAIPFSALTAAHVQPDLISKNFIPKPLPMSVGAPQNIVPSMGLNPATISSSESVSSSINPPSTAPTNHINPQKLQHAHDVLSHYQQHYQHHLQQHDDHHHHHHQYEDETSSSCSSQDGRDIPAPPDDEMFDIVDDGMEGSRKGNFCTCCHCHPHGIPDVNQNHPSQRTQKTLRRLRKLYEKKTKEQANHTSTEDQASNPKQPNDARAVDDLLSFIEGNASAPSKKKKKKKKKNKDKKAKIEETAGANSTNEANAKEEKSNNLTQAQNLSPKSNSNIVVQEPQLLEVPQSLTESIIDTPKPKAPNESSLELKSQQPAVSPDEIFAPKDLEECDNDAERELELFKRFCEETTVPKQRIKANFCLDPNLLAT